MDGNLARSALKFLALTYFWRSSAEQPINIWRRPIHIIAVNFRVLYKSGLCSGDEMTRQKKWHLEESESDGKGVILKSAGGEIRKPNAAQPLGCVSDVSVAEAGKDPEGLLVGEMCSKEAESVRIAT